MLSGHSSSSILFLGCSPTWLPSAWESHGSIMDGFRPRLAVLPSAWQATHGSLVEGESCSVHGRHNLVRAIGATPRREFVSMLQTQAPALPQSDLFGVSKWPGTDLSDLILGYQRVTLKVLAYSPWLKEQGTDRFLEPGATPGATRAHPSAHAPWPGCARDFLGRPKRVDTIQVSTLRTDNCGVMRSRFCTN